MWLAGFSCLHCKNLKSADLHSKFKTRRTQHYKESTMWHEIKRVFFSLNVQFVNVYRAPLANDSLGKQTNFSLTVAAGII